MNARKQIVIGLRLNGAIGRRLLTGVLRYPAEQSGWDVKIVHDGDELKRVSPRADGFIFDALADMDGFVPGILAGNRPAVMVNMPVPRHLPPRAGLVQTDDSKIGTIAADYLMRLGRFRSFGFVPAHGSKAWSQCRGRAFASALSAKGWTAQAFSSATDDSEEDLRMLALWVRSLPKPAAVFAAWDARALEVIDACRMAKVSVPRQLVLLGCDNTEMFCERSKPTLTSIDFNPEQEGFDAARLLDKLMRARGTVRERTLLGEVKGVVERESTRTPPPAAHMVERALGYMRENAVRGISPMDVARHLGVSRSLLYLRFMELENTSPAAMLQALRLDALHAALRRSNRPVSELTRECGFSSVNYAKAVFKKRFGVTMHEVRKTARR